MTINTYQLPPIKAITAFIIAGLLLTGAYAQQNSFKRFGYEQGLPESEITAMCEDPFGYLWIGTNGAGLIRYDGYDFQFYDHGDGLSHDTIKSIYLDHKGKVWVGMEKGVSIIEGTTFHRPKALKALDFRAITAIVQDDRGTYWLGSQNGKLYQYNGKNLKALKIPDNRTPVHTLCSNQKGQVWIGTGKGAYIYKNGAFQEITKHQGLLSKDIRDISLDKRGNMWLATNGGGIYKHGDNGFLNYNALDFRVGIRARSRLNAPVSNRVNTVQSDRNGNLWIGTMKGIIKMDRSTAFKTYFSNTGQSYDHITAILQSRAGNIWFGCKDGSLLRYDGERFMRYADNPAMGRQVYGIIQATNENMVFATSNGGITAFDGSTFSLSNDPRRFTNQMVQSLYYTPDSSLWIGTQSDGAFRFDKGFKQYKSMEGMGSNDINGVAMDKLGRIWLATPANGVSLLQTDTDSLVVFKNFTKYDGLSDNQVNTITNDNHGNIWIGGMSLQQFVIPTYDSLTPEIKHFGTNEGLKATDIQSILFDSTNTAYLGTSNGGIAIFDGQKFTHITKAEGLITNNVYALAFDDEGDLWAGTARGVDKLKLSKDFTVQSIQHFSKREGFPANEVYKNAIYKDQMGNLWFGTTEGVIKYDPTNEPLSPPVPKIHLTGIKLFFEDITKTKYAEGNAPWYTLPSSLVLPYDQNNLTFEFTGISLDNPEAVRYKWMMEGLNDNWSPPLPQREAAFSSLPPGNYTFKVMARNAQGKWSIKPATFQVTILQPIWQEPWFIACIIVTVILLIWGVFSLRLRSIRRKDRAIREKLEMEKNIIELEQEASRLQMNPHFIFNSLNSIQGFISTNEPFQAKKYLAKFARLMRLILENAREEFIPIQNEADILKNYLELEKLSTNHKFDYEVFIAPEIDPEGVEIPPMLIQPFVENAIIHGMKNKPSHGKITVNFHLSNDMVVCEVIDDGIGREAAKQRRRQASPNHKSTGISVTKRRLEQYKEQTGIDLGVTFTDLKEGEKALGTKVTVNIPFESF